MIELVKSPPTRILPKGRLALWLVVTLVFAALLFAAGAQARGTNVPEGAAETPVGEAATEGGAPAEQAASAAEQPPPAAEQAPPAAEDTSAAPPSAEQPPPATTETPPPAEQPPPTTEQAPPAAEETTPAAPPTAQQPPPAAEQPPPAAEQAPPAAPPAPEQAPPAAAETPASAEKAPPTAEAPPVVEKKTVEQTAGEVVAEAGSESTQGSGAGSQAPADASGLTHKDAGGEVASGVSIAVTTSTAPGAASEISTSFVQDQSSLVSSPRTSSAHRAGQVSCELATLGASIAAGDAGGWLDISAASSVSTIPFATVKESPTAIAADAPAGSQDGGSAVENHSSVPIPGSGSGGAGGGSTAGGGSGSTSSASFTLVGALLQAAPRAMRRLLLAQPSWRTSFFVLIPERPD